MKKCTASILVFALVCAALTLAVGAHSPARAGSIFYVSTSGSDSNPGSQAAPWRTPGYGSKQLKPGDTMIILGGRYVLSAFWDDMITPPAGGTASEPIVIKGEDGNRPVLAGRENLFSAADISGCSYLTVENLEITSDGGQNFRCGITGSGSPVDHVTLNNIYIHHIDEGAMDFADPTFLTVRNCIMSYCGFGGMGGPAGEHGGWRNVVVEGCTLSYSGHYYQGGPGPSPYDRPDGFGIEVSEGPIEIRNTLSEHNRGDGLDSKAANTYIHECIVANNTCDGVKLWGHDSRLVNTLIYGMGDGQGGDSPWAGIVISSSAADAAFEIENVTLQDNPTRHAYPMYVQYGEAVPMSVTIRNTIVANGSGVPYFAEPVKLTCDHNDFYKPGDPGAQLEANGRTYSAAELEAGTVGQGNLSRDPMFIAPSWGSTGNYHLKAGSPAIDTGSSVGAPTIDLDGAARPYGKAWDMGCYEYGAVKPVPGTRTWGHDSIAAAAPALKWYLTEGCTAGGFETWVLLQNPQETQANASITYMTASGSRAGPKVVLPRHSRATVNVAATVPDAFDVSAMVSSDRPIVVERSTYWGGRSAAHESVGVTEPSTGWYLPEGSTGGDFETWVLVMNPGQAEAVVSISYMLETGLVAGPTIKLPPGTRRSINVADTVPGDWSVSTAVASTQPVVAERAMYWATRRGGHSSIGVTEGQSEWYLAEGSTGGDFETWVLVQNTGAEDAHVNISYQTDEGSIAGPDLTLPPLSRKTVNVADIVPETWSVATSVTSDQPVAAERAVYWSARAEGHDSIGVSNSAQDWYIAEGSTGPGFETWVLVQNPGSNEGSVDLTFMTPEGDVAGPTLVVPAHTRQTTNVAQYLPGEWSVSTRVHSNTPVVCERAMYGSR
ncbi:MAG: DUF5719 family protein [Candidatus Geothermincolia bacterium]